MYQSIATPNHPVGVVRADQGSKPHRTTALQKEGTLYTIPIPTQPVSEVRVPLKPVQPFQRLTKTYIPMDKQRKIVKKYIGKCTVYLVNRGYFNITNRRYNFIYLYR